MTNPCNSCELQGFLFMTYRSVTEWTSHTALRRGIQGYPFMSFRAVTRYPEIPAKAGTRKRHFTGPRIECGVTRCASRVVRSVGTYRAAMRYPGRAGRGLPKCPRRESDKMAPTAKIRHEMAGLACGSGDGTGRKGGESWWWYGFCRTFSGFEN